MVSRRHAELRLNGGDWIVADFNSSYGTFLNGQRITAPQIVQAGDRIQIGQQGPILRVTRVSGGALPETRENPAPKPSEPFFTPSPKADFQTVPPPKTGIFSLAPVSGESLTQMPYRISKDSIWLGREAGCDIVFAANNVIVSRRHAEIKHKNKNFTIADNRSFNGTLVNERRISAPTLIYHGDKIRLGVGGPVLRFDAPDLPAPRNAGQQVGGAAQSARTLPATDYSVNSQTMVFRGGLSRKIASAQSAAPQLIMSEAFGDRRELVIGRDAASDIRLDGLQISNRHARIIRNENTVVVEDLNSTNGVYLNGNRVSRRALTTADTILIGAFALRLDAAGKINVFDTRAKTGIDAAHITKDVKNRAGGGTIRLLDDVSLSIQPNEFVGLLGSSGAGKSTLMDALNGMRPASGGRVFINDLDFYANLDSLKQSIGYVPQDDIIHRELTVARTLYYVAKLRLSRDVSKPEIERIIEEVLDVTGLTERRDVQIKQLSGGQRKRVPSRSN